jgi:hypothetical protein
MIAPPFANPAPIGGGGALRCLGITKTGKFFDNCVQVMLHNRNRGLPQRRGHAYMPQERQNYSKDFYRASAYLCKYCDRDTISGFLPPGFPFLIGSETG